MRTIAVAVAAALSAACGGELATPANDAGEQRDARTLEASVQVPPGPQPDAGPGPDAAPVITVLASAITPIDLAVDQTNVYWTNYAPAAVMKVSKSGGAPEVLAAQPGAGIAVDATSVYWANGGNAVMNAGAIMKMPVGGGAPVTLVGNLSNPRPVALDSSYVYWANDWGQHAGSVMRAGHDGSSPTVLAAGVDAPSDIAVSGNALCWVADDERSITCASLDGKNAVVVVSNTIVYSVATDGTDAYYIDGQSGLSRVSVTGGSPAQLAPTMKGYSGPVALDDTSIFFSPAANDGIQRISRLGGPPTPLTQRQAGYYEITDRIVLDSANLYWLGMQGSTTDSIEARRKYP